MRNLPSIVSKLPNDLKQFLERVREALGKGEIVTKEELIQAGIVRPGRGGTIESVDGSPIIPPAAFNVTATGEMTSIFVEFDYPEYRGHAYAEIWRAETNNLGLAQMVGQTPGKFYADAVGGAAVRWYWVRLVSTTDTAGPYNGTEGTRGETSSSPSYLLSLLTNQLTTSQLTSGLSARIDLIDAADTVNGSVNSRIKLTQDALQAQINAIANIPDYDNATTYSADDMVKYNGALYRATQGTTGNLPTNTTYWAKIGDYTSLGEAVAGLSGKIDAVNYVNAGSTSVSAQTLASLQAQVNDATTGLPYAHARITSESSARATADSAMATQISTLQSTVGNNTTSIQTQATTINGLSAQLTFKIDNNGYVTGYGLASTPVDGVPVSEFAVVADKFSIAPVATSHSANDGSPFFHLTSPTTINGVSIPSGTYMKSAYIHDASITNAKIANLAAEKITAGDIAADRMSANAIRAVNLSAQYIHADRIDMNTLTAKLAAIQTAYINEANINNGAITNAKIGEFIQSNNYAADSAGWRIDKSGFAEFANVKVRGEVNVGAFTDYYWPAAGQGGVHLSAKGLLLGNYNGGGKYFQITSGVGNSGNAQIYTNIPAYIENAQIKGAMIGQLEVDTINIKHSAISLSAFVNGTSLSVTVPSGGASALVIVSVTHHDVWTKQSEAMWFSYTYLLLNGVQQASAVIPLGAVYAYDGRAKYATTTIHRVLSLAEGTHTISCTSARSISSATIGVFMLKR